MSEPGMDEPGQDGPGRTGLLGRRVRSICAGARAAPRRRRLERFDDLDAALDAVEARWAELRDTAPQILDARRVLLLSTAELRGEFDAA
jgi:hypothetical protein